MNTTTTQNKSFAQAKTMAELLPDLGGIIPKDIMQTLTSKKHLRSTTALPRTAENAIKPLTMAELRADLYALTSHSTKKVIQTTASTSKKYWNSSVKIDNKKINHTQSNDARIKYGTVRKALNFQTKAKAPQTISNPRATINPETPKFLKPDFRSIKTHHIPVRNNVRISGVYKIADTPVGSIKPVRRRMTLANKENRPSEANTNRKFLPPPKPVANKRILIPPTANTPLNDSDVSFLQKEKEIFDIEEKIKPSFKEQTLENIEEVSPPVSTPFKEYRNVKEYFNNSMNSVTDDSVVYNSNTITCFDKQSFCKENSKREESVIVSLCDLLNKATVTSSDKTSIEVDELLEVEKQTKHNIIMIENGIETLLNIKESHLKSLQQIQKLIQEKNNVRTVSESMLHKNNVLCNDFASTPKVTKEELCSEKKTVIGKACSVIKLNEKTPLKSPSYKIPKKNLCLRKKVFYKSMPNVSNGMQSPNKDNVNKALNIYMKMKEQMNFLNTPIIKHRNIEPPDTPACTSHNLQKQLDKLYNGS